MIDRLEKEMKTVRKARLQTGHCKTLYLAEFLHDPDRIPIFRTLLPEVKQYTDIPYRECVHTM